MFVVDLANDGLVATLPGPRRGKAGELEGSLVGVDNPLVALDNAVQPLGEGMPLLHKPGLPGICKARFVLGLFERDLLTLVDCSQHAGGHLNAPGPSDDRKSLDNTEMPHLV